jgi:dienelactone hydrolase
VRSEPLGLWTGDEAAPEPYPELRALAFDFSSRGDRVPGRLLLPADGDGPFPTVILQHGAGGSRRADYLLGTGGPWARRGLAVASIDFPLHGERSEAKLSARLLAAIAARRHESAGGALRDLFRQAVMDLQRTADALERIPRVDAQRLAYAGFSMGTVIGAAFCAADPRPRCAAFAVGGAGLGPPGLDAVDHIGRIAPRPVLMVNTRGDATFPPDRVEELFAAAREPKELHWFDGTHRELPGAALKKMEQFLRASLLRD